MRERASLACMLLLPAISLAEAQTLDSMVGECGFPGGLIVHVNAGDISLTVAASRRGNFLVHGLYSDRAAFERARSRASENELAGRATVSIAEGALLPFIGNVVNLLVVEGGAAIPDDEMLRVITPRGRAYSRARGGWRQLRKPVPDTIDDWTHNLYDASNVAVSKDMEAAPPRHLQWVANPRYCRSHDANNSFQAMVSCAGRVFYIMDEGSKAFLSLPSKWFLTARDGFNGKVLWKNRLKQPLVTHLDHLKSGIGNLAHRIVAREDKVYVTMGFNAPVSALDSKTGKEIWVSQDSANAEELILHDNLLYCVINLAKESRSRHPYQSMSTWNRLLAAKVPRKVIALDVKSGRKVWEHVPEAVLPLSLTAGRYGVFYHDGESIVSLDGQTGNRTWRSRPVDFWRELKLYAGVNLVLYEDVLLFSCGRDYRNLDKRKKENTITALSAETGKFLWSTEHKQFTNYFTATDLMIADGLVWTAPIFSPKSSGKYLGLDPRTGTVVREFGPDTAKHMPHHRCHRNRGTNRYLFIGRTGVGVFDIRSGKWSHDYWVRGTCRYGMMPANGMLYAPPNSCACYVGAMIRGFNALTADPATRRAPSEVPDRGRLVKGPASGMSPRSSAASRRGDWPTYRGSAARHGMASSPMGETYDSSWRALLKGKLTQPVVAEGSVIVAAIGQHAVYALSEDDGTTQWRFQAGGIVNSPPTIWAGRAFFGCNDGWVYCLNARSGALAWKYRAAPVDRRIVACENVESLWPVNGSVLVLPDPEPGKARVYCIAGRSMFLDGGMRSLVLDAASGTKISETVMDHRDPDTGKSVQEGAEWPPDFPAARPDVLSCDNGVIYMGEQPFNLDGTRKKVCYPRKAAYGFDMRKRIPAKQKTDTSRDHLFSNVGFLDDSKWHRSLWLYGTDALGGCWNVNIPAFINPSGSILAVDGSNVYGYGREFFVEGQRATSHLFGVDKNPDVASVDRLKDRKIEIRGPYVRGNVATTPVWHWSRRIDVYVRALVVAGNADPNKPNLLFAVGAPDVIDEYDAMGLIRAEQRKGFRLDRIFEKEKAVAGRLGAKLIVVSSKDGTVLSETKLNYPAVFDGMSAANGRLFISNMNGEVVCLKPAR